MYFQRPTPLKVSVGSEVVYTYPICTQVPRIGVCLICLLSKYLGWHYKVGAELYLFIVGTFGMYLYL